MYAATPTDTSKRQIVRAIPTSDPGYPAFSKGCCGHCSGPASCMTGGRSLLQHAARSVRRYRRRRCCLNRSELIRLCADKIGALRSGGRKKTWIRSRSLSSNFDGLVADLVCPSARTTPVCSTPRASWKSDRLYLRPAQAPASHYLHGAEGLTGRRGRIYRRRIRRWRRPVYCADPVAPNVSSEARTQRAWVVRRRRADQAVMVSLLGLPALGTDQFGVSAA